MFPISRFENEAIRPHEAERLDVYQDSKGIWTVGLGFNLMQAGAQKACEACGVDYAHVMAQKGTKQPAITKEQSHALFVYCLNQLLPMVRHYVPSFDTLTENRQISIADLSWAGIGVLEEFHHMRDAIARQDWQTAAKEMLNSSWAKQVKAHRASQDADWMRNG